MRNRHDHSDEQAAEDGRQSGAACDVRANGRVVAFRPSASEHGKEDEGDAEEELIREECEGLALLVDGQPLFDRLALRAPAFTQKAAEQKAIDLQQDVDAKLRPRNRPQHGEVLPSCGHAGRARLTARKALAEPRRMGRQRNDAGGGRHPTDRRPQRTRGAVFHECVAARDQAHRP